MAKVDIHVLMEEAIVAAVREYAAANGISLAAAISILVKRGLQTEGQS